MGLLDEAIREHLELKRKRGADPAELTRDEQEALGPAVRQSTEVGLAEPGEPGLAGADEVAASGAAPDGAPAPESAPETEPARSAAEDLEPAVPDPDAPPHHVQAPDEDLLPDPEAPPPPTPAAPPEPERARDPQETVAFDADDIFADEDATAEPQAPAEGEAGDEDVLEETPEFLQETPEHDRLWFEQKPPRDFDFDG